MNLCRPEARNPGQHGALIYLPIRKCQIRFILFYHFRTTWGFNLPPNPQMSNPFYTFLSLSFFANWKRFMISSTGLDEDRNAKQ